MVVSQRNNRSCNLGGDGRGERGIGRERGEEDRRGEDGVRRETI